MPESEPLRALHTAVNCYLSTLQALSDCLGIACPEVGAPYGHRLSRLRSRLAFDSNPDAITESAQVIESELHEFAKNASKYVAQFGVELRRATQTLETIARSLGQRQDFYSARLRQFAAQMETTSYPSDPAHLSEVVALQSANLLGCVESMSIDAQSLIKQMREELISVVTRIQEAELTDPVTGLMNRREMERRLEARKASGEAMTLLLFHLTGDVRDEIAQQVAARLSSQFRYQDLICRWNEREFLVLFHGRPEIAQSRAEQIVPWVAGRYLLDDGNSVEIGVETNLTEPALVEAK